MNAALPEVPIKSRSVLVFFVELAEITQVPTNFVGGNGGVFPAFPSKRLTGNESSGSQSGLTDIPNFLLFFFVYTKLHLWRIRAFQGFHRVPSLLLGFFGCPGAELRNQPTFALG